MKPRPARLASLLTLASVALTAQIARRETVVPLKNWATPLYWQPSQAETQGTGKTQPQLHFSANQVPTNALTFIAITPCRLVDTRGALANFNGISPFSGPAIAATTTVTFPVQASAEASADTTPAPCGAIPSIAQAYSLNLTVVPVTGGAVDYISMWPSGYSQPFVATLNDPQGAIVANAAIVPAGTVSGGISVYNQGPGAANVIIDMNGFFASPTDLTNNTAIGAGTLASNTTGNANTAVGDNVLQANTAGVDNTAAGFIALQANTTGSFNTASGYDALGSNTTASGNAAFGYEALYSNTTGVNNAASGASALAANTTGNDNTASGGGALQFNTAGGNNTAIGFLALQGNTTGSNNTAIGAFALESNTGGTYDTASGYQALQNNTDGTWNTASGHQALLLNTTGSSNTADGVFTLQNNTTGNGNTAIGKVALNANTTGTVNTAIGVGSLESNTTGSFNIAIGNNAAIAVSGGNSNNIDIGNVGLSTDGATANNGVIRIGTVGTQTSAFIAGIYGGLPSTPNLQVCVDANGTLGTTGCTGTASSRRFKEQITDMGDSSNKLLQLRPVTFLYKPEYDDGSHSLQYGLIAEEVEKIYPEMVGYDKDGRPASVKYQSLTPMLLNEVQKQNARIQNQAEVNEFQHEQNQRLEEQLAELQAQLSSLAATVAQSASSQ